MSKFFVSVITAISCFSSMISPALADGINDVFSLNTQAKAGVYFRLPFAGGLKKSEKYELSYGFAMGFGRTQAGSSFMAPRRTFNADVIKLNFNAQGFKNFNVGGQDIFAYSDGQLNFLKNDEGEWHWTNISLVVTGVIAAVIVYESLKPIGDCPKGYVDCGWMGPGT